LSIFVSFVSPGIEPMVLNHKGEPSVEPLSYSTSVSYVGCCSWGRL